MIENAYATGAVTGGDVADAGGLVGTNGDMIENAYATGAVTGGGDAIVGGLAGSNGGTIEEAYATGAVTRRRRCRRAGRVQHLRRHDRGRLCHRRRDGGHGGLQAGWSGPAAAALTRTIISIPRVRARRPAWRNIAGVTGLSTTQLEGALAGFSSTVWGNVGGQTTPYLLNNIGQQSVYVGAETYTLDA